MAQESITESRRDLYRDVHKRTDDHTESKPPKSPKRVEYDDTGDDADVVQERRKRVERVSLVHLCDGPKNVREPEKNGLQEHDACQHDQGVQVPGGAQVREESGKKCGRKKRRKSRDDDGEYRKSNEDCVNVFPLLGECAAG